MRLYEITDITQDKFTPQRVPRKGVRSSLALDDEEYVGSGLYSEVFSTSKEPGTVRKISRPRQKDLKSDAYFQYVNMLAKNKLMFSNPYFPRIFDIQVKRYPDKKSPFRDLLSKRSRESHQDWNIYAVDIERLHPFVLSEKEARMLSDRMFHDFNQSSYKAEDAKSALVLAIDRVLSKKSGKEALTTIKDAKFKQAVILIHKLIQSHPNFSSDIHDGNIMIRRGSGGIQIVLSDPVKH